MSTVDDSSKPDVVESTQLSNASSLLSLDPTQYSMIKGPPQQQSVVPLETTKVPKDSCVTAKPGSKLKTKKDSCLTARRKASSQLRTARKWEPWETVKFVPDDAKKAPLIPRVSSKSRSRVKYVPTKETPADWNETRYEHYKSEMQSLRKELASLTDSHVQAVNRLEEKIAKRQVKLENEILDQLEEARGKRMVRYCYCKDTFKNKIKSCSKSMWYCFGKYLRGFSVFCCPPLCTATNRAAFWPPPRGYFFFRPPDGVTSRKTDTEEERAPTDEDNDEWVQLHIDKLIKKKKTYTKLKKATRESCEGSWKISNSHDCGEDMHDVEGFVLETSTGNFIACCRCPYLGNRKEKFCVLYSHPSGSDMSDHLLGVPSLRDMAVFHRCDVYSYDYSGFGISTGSPGEMDQNADIRAVYKHLLDARGYSADNIILLGFSIGTAASVDLVASLDSLPAPAGLILLAPPLSIIRVLFWNRGCFGEPWAEKTCCLDRYSTFDKIATVRCPVLVCHGAEDTMVPVSHGRTIYKRAGHMAVTPCWIRDSDHDNLENFREVWVRIRYFFKHEIRGGWSAETEDGQGAAPPYSRIC